MKKTVYVYKLTDAQNNECISILNDISDNATIGGYDKNGNYQQYDSYELYHAYSWAEKHEFKLESGKMEIEIPEFIFNET